MREGAGPGKEFRAQRKAGRPERYDVDVSWWVTPAAYERGYYTKVYRALRHWLTAEFPFSAAWYSNAEIPSLSDGAL